MTILVTGYITLARGEGAKAKDLLLGHMAEVAKEDGCETYVFSYDIADPDTIRITERWASPEALARHGEADHQKAFGRALRAYQPQAMQVDAWDGEFWRNLLGG